MKFLKAFNYKFNKNCKRFTSSLTSFDLSSLEEICKTGKVPEKFNFAQDVFDLQVKVSPDKAALWIENDETDRKWTFAQLRKESIRASVGLKNLLKPSEDSQNPIILVLLPRIPEWWYIYLASIRIGAVFCPATTLLTPQDIAYRLDASLAKGIITDDLNMWKIEEAEKLRKNKTTALKKIVVREKPIGMGLNAEGWNCFYDLTDAVTKVQMDSFVPSSTKANDLAQIFFTSGTTGKPKMVAHSQASYGIGHYKTGRISGLKGDDIHWNISDNGWAKSSYASFFAPWIFGSTVYIHQMQRFESRKVLEILCKRPITTFCAPPTLYRSMLHEKDSELFKFKSLRYAAGAGEAVNPHVAKTWEEKTGIRLHEFYGQTETAAIGDYYDSPRKEGSIGRIKTFDIRIVDENNKEVKAGVEGSVAIPLKPFRPVGLFLGYLKAGTHEVDDSHPSWSEHFYNLGDRAYLDEEGYLFHVGRADDVIISAGYRIGPFEVESVLQEHPAVVESAAVASPDTQRGAIVKAYVVLAENYRGKNKEDLIIELQNFVKANTAPYKYPRKIEFVESLPKTISGKILRRELRANEYKNE